MLAHVMHVSCMTMHRYAYSAHKHAQQCISVHKTCTMLQSHIFLNKYIMFYCCWSFQPFCYRKTTHALSLVLQPLPSGGKCDIGRCHEAQ